MKYIQLLYEHTACICKEYIDEIAKRLQPEIERLQKAYKHGYDSIYASINLSHDEVLRNNVHLLAQEKKLLNIECLIVVGIGGSNLGTIAIHEALHGKYYNELDPDVKVYFVDTVDPDAVRDIVFLIEKYIISGKKILLNVVTKSGTTTETIANFEVILELFKKYYSEDYNKYVVVITDKESPLWHLANKQQFSLLEIPIKVGGRFSVLSAVGLFACAMLGIDINALHAGARDIIAQALTSNVYQNPAALSAIIKYVHYSRYNININNFFVFSGSLESSAKWYRQLMGESIGKEFDIKGKKVNVGITPTVSVGTVDLHSVGQLYLGGPYDKFITFCSLQTYNYDVKLPDVQQCAECGINVEGKPLSEIMNAILQGVKKAYQKENRPFCELIIPKREPQYIGQFLQLYMIEIIYLGFLLNINPFDQPNVELYKQETRKILKDD